MASVSKGKLLHTATMNRISSTRPSSSAHFSQRRRSFRPENWTKLLAQSADVLLHRRCMHKRRCSNCKCQNWYLYIYIHLWYYCKLFKGITLWTRVMRTTKAESLAAVEIIPSASNTSINATSSSLTNRPFNWPNPNPSLKSISDKLHQGNMGIIMCQFKYQMLFMSITFNRHRRLRITSIGPLDQHIGKVNQTSSLFQQGWCLNVPWYLGLNVCKGRQLAIQHEPLR